jgi:hypothetical protein
MMDRTARDVGDAVAAFLEEADLRRAGTAAHRQARAHAIAERRPFDGG